MFSPLSVVTASGGTEELDLSPLYGEKRLVDKTVTVCRRCGTRKSTDRKRMKHGHVFEATSPGVSLTGVKTKAAQQPHITAATMQPLVAQSDRLKHHKRSGCVYRCRHEAKLG